MLLKLSGALHNLTREDREHLNTLIILIAMLLSQSSFPAEILCQFIFLFYRLLAVLQ